MTDPVYRTFVVPPGADKQRIDLFLSQCCDGYSRTQIRLAVHEDGAEVDGRIIRPSYKLKAGQSVRFRLPPPPTDDTVPENIPLSVLYEDDALVVINKSAGMVVHPSRGHWSGTLTAALAYRFRSLSDVGGPTRPGIVHRLDRDTSGVIVVAKTNAVHLHLSEQFADRTVSKEYFAFAVGHIDRDRDWIDASIGLHPYQRDKQAIRSDHPSVRPAQTFYEVLDRRGKVSMVRLRPKTGRTHQLRVHLAHLGHPILCDRLYGGHREISRDELRGVCGSDAVVSDRNPLVLSRQALHARRLTFRHPQTAQEMTFTAPWPEDLIAVAEVIGGALPSEP
ncbi:MAG: RluA family pseudouridine synthase [Planctomycetota bacterium]